MGSGWRAAGGVDAFAGDGARTCRRSGVAEEQLVGAENGPSSSRHLLRDARTTAFEFADGAAQAASKARDLGGQGSGGEVNRSRRVRPLVDAIRPGHGHAAETGTP